MNENIKEQAGWQKVLFVLMFWIVFYVAQMVVAAVAIAQCLFLLFTGDANQQLRRFGDAVSKYIHDILRYVTFNTEERPFPFTDFPKPDLIIPANPSTS